MATQTLRGLSECYHRSLSHDALSDLNSTSQQQQPAVIAPAPACLQTSSRCPAAVAAATLCCNHATPAHSAHTRDHQSGTEVKPADENLSASLRCRLHRSKDTGVGGGPSCPSKHGPGAWPGAAGGSDHCHCVRCCESSSSEECAAVAACAQSNSDQSVPSVLT
jgi:hypothetical protein